MSRTRSASRRAWAARPTVARTAIPRIPTSDDALARQKGPAIGRPRGAHGSRNGAPPNVTPSRVMLQQSVGPAPFSPFVFAHRAFDSAALEIGVARGEREASNSHTLPQRPRQTGLPGPTPSTLHLRRTLRAISRVLRKALLPLTVSGCARRFRGKDDNSTSIATGRHPRDVGARPSFVFASLWD